MSQKQVPHEERRCHERGPIQQNTKFRMGPGSGFYTSVVQNISSGGVFVRSETAPDVGADITIDVSIPRLLDPTPVSARVVWVRSETELGGAEGARGYCFGARFTQVPEVVEAAIEEYVEQLALQRTPDGALPPRPPRKEIHSPLKYHAGDEPGFYTGWAQNISDGGILVHTSGRLPEQGSIVKVSFRVPYLDKLVELEAEVRWHRDEHALESAESTGGAFGARFVNVSDEVKSALDRYMKSSETFFYPDEDESR